MHYRTPRVDFLTESEEELVAAMPQTARLGTPEFDTASCPPTAARSPWLPPRLVHIKILNQTGCAAMVPLPGLTRAQPNSERGRI
jgi:hypothetical protein